MKIISADFNAMTKGDGVRLTTRGSQEDMRRLGVKVGDWLWLSDGELIVGAQVAMDGRFGEVGLPDWRTLVHLDDDGADDVQSIWPELQMLLKKDDSTEDEDARIYDLAMKVEHYAAPELVDPWRIDFAKHRARFLKNSGSPKLALAEFEELREGGHLDAYWKLIYLDFLRRVEPRRALELAQEIAVSDEATAVELAASISVISQCINDLPAFEFHLIARCALEWCERFEQAPGREQLSDLVLSLVLLNRGLLLLRMGDQQQAHSFFVLAQLHDPSNPILDEATRLVDYDQRAREIATLAQSQPFAA